MFYIQVPMSLLYSICMVSNSEIVSSGVRLFYYDLNVTRWHLKQIFLGKDLIAL